MQRTPRTHKLQLKGFQLCRSFEDSWNTTTPWTCETQDAHQTKLSHQVLTTPPCWPIKSRAPNEATHGQKAKSLGEIRIIHFNSLHLHHTFLCVPRKTSGAYTFFPCSFSPNYDVCIASPAATEDLSAVRLRFTVAELNTAPANSAERQTSATVDTRLKYSACAKRNIHTEVRRKAKRGIIAWLPKSRSSGAEKLGRNTEPAAEATLSAEVEDDDGAEWGGASLMRQWIVALSETP